MGPIFSLTECDEQLQRNAAARQGGTWRVQQFLVIVHRHIPIPPVAGEKYTSEALEAQHLEENTRVSLQFECQAGLDCDPLIDFPAYRGAAGVEIAAQLRGV